MKFVFALIAFILAAAPASAQTTYFGHVNEKVEQVLATAVKRCQPNKTCWAQSDKESYERLRQKCHGIGMTIRIMTTQPDKYLPGLKVAIDEAKRDQADCQESLGSQEARILREHTK